MDSMVLGSESPFLPDLHSSLSPSASLPCFIPLSPFSLLLLLTFSPLTCPLICLLPTILSSFPTSSHLTSQHCSRLLPLTSPCPPRSAQPAYAVRAVGRLQARTGTSSGLEITASAPGAPSSMRKVGTCQGTWALGNTGQWARLLDRQDRSVFLAAWHPLLAMEPFFHSGYSPQKPIRYLR